MDIHLDRESATPLYRQIVAQVIAGIEDGRLAVGTLLPPERKLADRLNVNRTTVVTAYRDLVATGMVEARVGRGTRVSDAVMDGANPPRRCARRYPGGGAGRHPHTGPRPVVLCACIS